MLLHNAFNIYAKQISNSILDDISKIKGMHILCGFHYFLGVFVLLTNKCSTIIFCTVI